MSKAFGHVQFFHRLIVTPPNWAAGGFSVYLKPKEGFPLLASLLTGLFYAMSKKVNSGRRYIEHQPRDQGVKAT